MTLANARISPFGPLGICRKIRRGIFLLRLNVEKNITRTSTLARGDGAVESAFGSVCGRRNLAEGALSRVRGTAPRLCRVEESWFAARVGRRVVRRPRSSRATWRGHPIQSRHPRRRVEFPESRCRRGRNLEVGDPGMIDFACSTLRE